MVTQIEISLPQYPRGMHLITDYIEREVMDFRGPAIVNVFIRHSSAGICLKENADPWVRIELDAFFDRLVSVYHTYPRRAG